MVVLDMFTSCLDPLNGRMNEHFLKALSNWKVPPIRTSVKTCSSKSTFHVPTLYVKSAFEKGLTTLRQRVSVECLIYLSASFGPSRSASRAHPRASTKPKPQEMQSYPR